MALANIPRYSDESYVQCPIGFAWRLSSRNPQRCIFWEQALLARAGWTSSSAMWVEAWAVIETHAVLSAGDGRQTYLNDSVTRSRDGGPHLATLTARVMSTQEHSLRIISRPGWSSGFGRAARQFAMCYKFLSAVSLFAMHSPLLLSRQSSSYPVDGW